MDRISNSFWSKINQIAGDDFTPKGLNELEEYAEQFAGRRIVYKRFSSQEQHGCSAGGVNNVIASLLAGAKVAANGVAEGCIKDFKSELKLAEKQIDTIKHWAKKANVWIDKVY